MGIQLSKEIMDTIRDEGERAFPHECCGFLLGRNDDGCRKVTATRPAENIREEGERRNRYTISPTAYMQCEQIARAKGLDLIGFYHSHPDAPARPSPYDLEHAWPWFSYLILAVSNGQAVQATSWVLEEDRGSFSEETVEVET